MKKVLSVILSTILLLTILPVSTLPTGAENAGQAESFFRVEVSGNTFTIRRSNNLQSQTVAYRTVSVTAVEGIHFTAAIGTLTFNAGDWSKTVTVTEMTSWAIPVRYRYQSGTKREYRFEVIDNYGFLLASATRQIDYDKSFIFDNNSVNSSVVDLITASGSTGTTYGGWVNYIPSSSTAVTDDGYADQNVLTISTNDFYTNMPGLAPKDYLSAIGDKLYMSFRLSVTEKNDGYQYVQVLTDNTTTCDGNDPYEDVNTPVISYYKACFERDVGSDANTMPCYMIFPHRYDCKNTTEELAAGVTHSQFVEDENQLWAQKYRDNTVKAANAGAILLDPMVETVNFRFDAGGNGSDTWYRGDMRVCFAPGDEFPPYPTDSVYVSRNSPYTKHSPVTITICFNEIVVPSNNCVLKTTWGDLTVINTSSRANVLSFTGPITANPGTVLKITGIQGTVSDLFGRNMEGSYTQNLSYTVGQNATPPSSGGVYLISNAAQLYAYADILETSPNSSGRLLADIDMTNSERAGFKAMGGTSGFTGTFDGDGHKIINLQNVSGTSNGFCGLFGYISTGGRVEDLDLEISFTAPLGCSGAICGFNRGTVENCTVSGKITNSVADSAQATASNRFGGVVGDNCGTIIHCLALNDITNRWQTVTVGGIAGYNGGTVDSCCFCGTFSSNNAVTRGAVCGENAANGTVTNCAARNLNTNYYSSAFGTNNGTATNTQFMSTSDFSSGKACYEVLNNSVSDGTQFWYQNLDNGQTHDDCPQFTGGAVYKHGNGYTNTAGHTLSHVDAVAVGCETDGCAEYWVCTVNGCGKIFTDANAQNETTLAALTITAPGHDMPLSYAHNTLQHWRVCSRCGYKGDTQNHDYVAGSGAWFWTDYDSANVLLTCSVCGATYLFSTNVSHMHTSTAITFTASINVNGTTFTDQRVYPMLVYGENAPAITEAEDTYYFFIPSKTAEYSFFSTGDFDPMISVFDTNGNLLADMDNISNANRNFNLSIALEAGRPYCISLYSREGSGSLPTYLYARRDLNENGVEDASDYDFLVSAALGDATLTVSQQAKADINGDGVVDVLDCRLFKLLSQGKDLPT